MKFVAIVFVVAIACSVNEHKEASVPKVKGTETERLNAFFERVYQKQLQRDPMTRAYLGIKEGNDAWGDQLTEAYAQESLALDKQALQTLQTFKFDKLDETAQLSYQLFKREKKLAIEGHKWRYHDFPVNQKFGYHTFAASFLVNFHQIDNEADARAYISRLRRLPKFFEQLEAALVERQNRGIVPPAFVFPKAIAGARGVIKGKPFDSSDTDSAILEDFKSKLAKLTSISRETRNSLVSDATSALTEAVQPAYLGLIDFLGEQSKLAQTTVGAWSLPKGSEFYAYSLRYMTTTNMNADDIHRLGLKEVARIHTEMKAIMGKVGFDGTLGQFFKHLRGEEFHLPNTEKGRQEYLSRVGQVIDGITLRLPELFHDPPQSPLRVKRVERFHEKTAGIAYYSPPSSDGGRPGIYYVNLSDMKDMPTYQLEALAYHEGLPGHHLQNAKSQSLDNLPKFRRFGFHVAYGEGWGLYAEYLPKEIGMYQDPYSDFGRLAMELWRACRLVVDTGIHDKKWTRKQAIDYLMDNTPDSRGAVMKAVERYIVSPGQATAYKIGMLKILELRQRAQKALGDSYDVRDFHRVVLENGPLPLDVLDDTVDAWIAETTNQ